VDLSTIANLETSALDLLRWALEHESSRSRRRPVGFLLPASLPDRTATDHRPYDACGTSCVSAPATPGTGLDPRTGIASRPGGGVRP
jgi:hypothetical protein